MSIIYNILIILSLLGVVYGGTVKPECTFWVSYQQIDPTLISCTATEPCSGLYNALEVLSNTDSVVCPDTVDRYINIVASATETDTYDGVNNIGLFIRLYATGQEQPNYQIIIQSIDAIPTSTTDMVLPIPSSTKQAIFDAQGKSNIFNLQQIPGSVIVFRGLTFQNGISPGGKPNIDSPIIIGSIRSISFDRCQFNNNQGNTFGAISWEPIEGGNITNCQFNNNKASIVNGHGGAIHMTQVNSETLILNSTFSGSVAYKGGAIYCSKSNLIMHSTTFQNSNATFGGALYLESISRTIGEQYWTDLQFLSNNASRGGAIYDLSCIVSYQRAIFTKNTALRGGAIAFENSVSAVNQSSFSFNSATEQGGAIWVFDPSPNDLPLVVKLSTFESNSAGVGGAMYCDSATATLNSSNTYLQNTATNDSSEIDYCTSTCLTTTKQCACYSGCGLPPVPVQVITDKRETRIAIAIFLPVTAILLGIVGFLLWKTNEKAKLQKPSNLSYDEIRLTPTNMYEKQQDVEEQL